MATVHEFQKMARPFSVLYVEDDENIRKETRQLLEKFFKSVRTAADGEEGLALYRQYHDDIIITDVNMPRLSGLEMTKKIREFDQNVPIVIFSAYDDKANLLMAIDNGISQYVIKPLDIPIFILSLKKVLIQLNLEKKIVRLNNRLWDILNTMDELVVSYKKDLVTVANRHFLDFFGMESVRQLVDKQFDLSQLLVKEKSYTYADSWSELLAKLERGNEAIVKLYDKKHTAYRKFLLHFNHLSSNDDEYMLTLTDISRIAFAKNEESEKGRVDPLTKVFSRTYLQQLLDFEIRHAGETGSPLSVLLLDIDNFKTINDHFGYAVGDKILAEFAAILKEETKKTMHLGRWGGNVFLVIAAVASPGDMVKLGERISRTISEHRFEGVGKLSCSVAVTEYKSGDTVDSLMLRGAGYISKSKHEGGGKLESDATRKQREVEEEQEREEIVTILKGIIEDEEKVMLHNFFKGLPVNGEAKLLHIENGNNLALSLKQNLAYVMAKSQETIITHPRLPLPVHAKVTSVSVMEMVVTVSAYTYMRTCPIDRAVVRLDMIDRVEVAITKGVTRISGQMIDISSRSLAFYTFSYGSFNIRDDVSVEFELMVDEKHRAHFKAMGKVIMIIEEGEYFKVVVLIYNSKQSEMLLQQYLANRQLALTQEILDFSL